MHPKRRFLIGLILILLWVTVPQNHAQLRAKADSSKLFQLLRSTEHSPSKSALYSALIPGWGQAYNRKYWKIPIVYAGLATVGYFIYDNHHNYVVCRDDYIRLYEDPEAEVFNKDDIHTTSQLLPKIDEYRKNRDMSVIIMLAVWGLNVVDANVDGHFFNYDVSDDLSLILSPIQGYLPGKESYLGINLVFEMH
ncbi:MAG: hypothetical protein HN352_04240 [Bacteroidetes bacterium]|nr:hypothetical protein [Bacteroidota bacterium]MBT3751402.1 hypothetical protein [Bacteroidota bacterium]MBT4397897.1 hypothetical protein [Bacteroidota bacterium]MBT4411516.1 hypothetical protein [Bacteroidota bacterium]MBT5425901.1 hypothetical protein [Bacteroidota bacterium]